MSRLIDKGLENLSRLIFKMGELAEEAVSLSFDCYLKGMNTYERVQTLSETLVSLSEKAEDKAVELIVRYQPVASDLRAIKSYMKIAYDFSRYGRYAWDITHIHKKLNIKLNECKFPWIPLEEFSEKVLEMVHISIEVVKRHDVNLAKKLGIMEMEIDEIYYKCLNKLAKQSSLSTRCIISIILFIRHLERIADHAAYIGESVIYIITGERISLR